MANVVRPPLGSILAIPPPCREAYKFPAESNTKPVGLTRFCEVKLETYRLVVVPGGVILVMILIPSQAVYKFPEESNVKPNA